jgi:hypothetical protein
MGIVNKMKSSHDLSIARDVGSILRFHWLRAERIVESSDAKSRNTGAT